jgi:hypothetical protein
MSAVIQESQPSARILDVTEDQYHSDPCATASLNQTIAKILLEQSPLHAWCAHPKLGGLENSADDGEEDTDATRGGKVIHKLLLGKGCDIEVINVDAYRTNAAKAARDEAIAAGRVPMKAKQYDDLCAAAETIKGNLALEGIDLGDPDGQSEVAIEWAEQGEHGPVTCRCRVDRIHLNRGVIWDLKKIVSADGKTCSRHVQAYGYHLQHASNTRALAALRPELAGRIDMLFVFMEVEPPYAVRVARPSGVMVDMGLREWERAVLLWERCLRTNRWPGYGGGIAPLEPTHWHATEVLGNEW